MMDAEKFNRKSLMSLPTSFAILAFAIIKVQLLNIFKPNLIISQVNLLPIQNSSTSRTKLLLAMITNKQFQEFSVFALFAQMGPTLWTDLYSKACK